VNLVEMLEHRGGGFGLEPRVGVEAVRDPVGSVVELPDAVAVLVVAADVLHFGLAAPDCDEQPVGKAVSAFDLGDERKVVLGSFEVMGEGVGVMVCLGAHWMIPFTTGCDRSTNFRS
jgi:hypothetical protein